MKKFKVELSNHDGVVVLNHVLFAKDEKDANQKLLVLLDNVRDKSVCSGSVFEFIF